MKELNLSTVFIATIICEHYMRKKRHAQFKRRKLKLILQGGAAFKLGH